MEPLPDLKELRQSVQRQHWEHIRVELELARTFMEMHELEKNLGEADSAARSIYHSRQALIGARKGLPNIDDLAARNEFEEQIKAQEEEIARKEPK